MSTLAGGRAVTAGRIVRYMSPKGMRAAIVTANADDVDPADVESGATGAITTEGGAHLVWFDHAVFPTHGGSTHDPPANVAVNVAYAQDDGEGIPVGTWTWPDVK